MLVCLLVTDFPHAHVRIHTHLSHSPHLVSFVSLNLSWKAAATQEVLRGGPQARFLL